MGTAVQLQEAAQDGSVFVSSDTLLFFIFIALNSCN